MSRPDPSLKHYWMFGVRTGLRILNLQQYVSDPVCSIIFTTPVQVLCAFMEESLPQIVRCGPSLVSTYLGFLPEQQKTAYWHRVLSVITSYSTNQALDWLDRFTDTRTPLDLHPSQDFEAFAKKTVLMTLEDRTSNLKQALLLLERSGLLLRAYFRSLLADSQY